MPVDEQLSVQKQDLDLNYCIVSVNEVRSERGLPPVPVPWGNAPWLTQRWAPTHVPRSQPGEQEPPPPSGNCGSEDDDPVVDDQ